MSTAPGRDALFARIRSALGRDPGQPPPPLPSPALRVPSASSAERVRRFVVAFEALNGKAVVVSSPDAAREAVRVILAGRSAVASNSQWLESCGISQLPGVQRGFTGRDALRAACASAGAGITGVSFALAETGTFVMLAGTEEPRLISLLPPLHIAVLPSSRILTNLDEVITQFPVPAEQTSSMVLITGPSRTADIEQILVRGVHGPGEVCAVIVQEEKAA